MSDREFGGECVCGSKFESESRLLFLIFDFWAARTFLEACLGGCLGSSLQMQGIDTAATLSSAFTFFESWYGRKVCTLSSSERRLSWTTSERQA